MLRILLPLVLLAASPAPKSWLDATLPVVTWVGAAAKIPVAPREKPLYVMPYPCDVRSASSAEDRAVQKAGWRLIGPNERWGDTQVLFGTANYDGMCRPFHYQGFVFSGGTFVGTLSPTLMAERDEGSLDIYAGAGFYSESQFSVDYERYVDADAACCPHARTRVTFEIVRGKLTIRDANTSKNAS